MAKIDANPSLGVENFKSQFLTIEVGPVTSKINLSSSGTGIRFISCIFIPVFALVPATIFKFQTKLDSKFKASKIDAIASFALELASNDEIIRGTAIKTSLSGITLTLG